MQGDYVTKRSRMFPFPMSFSLDQIVRSDAFRRDATRVLRITDELFEAANVALESATGSIGRSRIRTIVGGVLEDEDQAEGFIQFVLNFSDLRREFEVEPSQLVNDVVQRTSKFSEPEQATLGARLDRVLRTKPGLERQAKVDDVAQKTGSHLDQLCLVTDLRPVFDETRENIEALVPMTTLKMVVHGDSGLTSVEVRMTEQELANLADEVSKARKKLATLGALVRKQPDIELPESEMVMPIEAGAS